jgi:hypothetical protein
MFDSIKLIRNGNEIMESNYAVEKMVMSSIYRIIEKCRDINGVPFWIEKGRGSFDDIKNTYTNLRRLELDNREKFEPVLIGEILSPNWKISNKD